MITLGTSVSALGRVGTKLKKYLNAIGIETCKDLIFYFPYRFDDFTSVRAIADVRPGETVTIQGRIDIIENRRSRKRRMIVTEAFVSDSTGSIKVVWFNQPFLIKNLCVGDDVSLSGRTNDLFYDLQMVSPAHEKITTVHETVHTARLVPVYSLPAHITQKQFRLFVHQALSVDLSPIQESLPPEIRTKEKLPTIHESLRAIHYPESIESFECARRRFAFEEFFFLRLSAARARIAFAALQSFPILQQRETTNACIASLPFSLTQEQKNSAQEIFSDIGKSMPMNRLLQGEVGSGKTIVAVLALLNCAKAGRQSLFMTPTEILARQHYATITTILRPFGISIALLTSGSALCNQGEEEMSRDAICASISSGTIDIIIGTHALLQERIQCKDLALAVIDEQHRFGVRQRKLLREKNDSETMPHLLSLTATPIPRSLALTMYGDLDISVIRELPQGRKKIITKIVPQKFREWTYGFVKKQIQKGHQAFIICPLIDISDTLGAKSVKEEYKKLHTIIFPDLRIGMLHGRMKQKEKEDVMRSFLERDIDILVATSLIEVGVDIPNASSMIIEGAERFGLAQLHQLRGRVGRSEHQSYCFLIPSDESRHEIARLKAVVATQDGFELAERDLSLRGEGDLFGMRQAGLPQLKIASLADLGLIQSAQEWAGKYSGKIDECVPLKEALERFSHDIHLE